MLEVRAGYKTQHLPVFVRMMDKDSVWTGQRGLNTVIPTALLFGILGYPYVLPDMIGGNAYDETGIGAGDKPEKELYIRWMQLTTFLPCMQFSVPPWDYGADVMDLLQNKLLLIRKNFVTPTLIKIAKESVQQRKSKDDVYSRMTAKMIYSGSAISSQLSLALSIVPNRINSTHLISTFSITAILCSGHILRSIFVGSKNTSEKSTLLCKLIINNIQ